jgi:hypothetical protein
MAEQPAASKDWMIPLTNAKPTLAVRVTCAVCLDSRLVDVRAVPESGRPLCAGCFKDAKWQAAKLATQFRLGA